jgi:hypothetical protein
LTLGGAVYPSKHSPWQINRAAAHYVQSLRVGYEP